MHLLLPGVLFSLLAIVFEVLKNVLAGKEIFEVFKSSIIDLGLLKFQHAMWFLPCYFFAEIMFLLLVKREFFKMQTILICLLSFLFGVLSVILSEADVLIRLSRLMIAICFIGIGVLFYKAVVSKLIQLNERKEDTILSEKTHRQQMAF